MDREKEFKGILNGVSAEDIKDLLDQLPDAESEREGLEEDDHTDVWGSSGSLKYRRDY